MGFVQILMLALGCVGLGAGVYMIWKREAKVYFQGEIRHFWGRSAQIIGIGLVIPGLGALALGIWGFQPAVMAFGILCSGVFFAARTIANRMAEQDNT